MTVWIRGLGSIIWLLGVKYSITTYGKQVTCENYVNNVNNRMNFEFDIKMRMKCEIIISNTSN